MRYLNLEKASVDQAVKRTLEMRVNRGLKMKLFKKQNPFPISRYADLDKKLLEHRLKVA